MLLPFLSTLLLLVFFTCTGDIAGVEIRSLHIPAVVESGSESHVLLDCNYDVNEREVDQVDVKWFFNDNPQPFFQWLPGRRPQTVGELFKHRIDLDYVAAGEENNVYKRHRVLKLLNPTAELSGTYKCKVSSFIDEDFMEKEMLVFAPASDVVLTYRKADAADSVSLSCSVRGIYPEPVVRLSVSSRAGVPIEALSSRSVEKQASGLYDVSVQQSLLEAGLEQETVFTCLVSIPGTSYLIKEETMYFPGRALLQLNSSPAGGRWNAMLVLGVCLASLVVLLHVWRR